MNLDLIKERLRIFYKRHQRLPTHGEMVKLLHYSSRGSTYYVVKKLIQEGVVEKDANGRLIPKNLFNIPMLGVIKAGSPIPADVQSDRYLNLHLLFQNISGATYALTISGDSMIDAGIVEGDVVIIDKQKQPVNGDIVAACVDGEWTVKYFQHKDGVVSLLPANEEYQPIYPQISLEVGGVVVSVIRQYQ